MPRLFFPATLGNDGGSAPVITPPTLAVVDNGDGTGATATIGGGTSGVNTVYTRSFATPFVPSGTRTGNGTVALSLLTGSYVAYSNGPSGASPAVSFQVTGGNAAGSGPYSRIVDAVITAVTGLGLTLDSAVVPIEQRDELEIDEGVAAQPILIIAPDDTSRPERLFGQTFLVPYGVVVALVVPGRLDYAAVLTGETGSLLDWRDQLATALREPTSLGLNFVQSVRVTMDPAIAKRYVKKGFKVVGASFTFTAMEDDP